MYITMKQCVVLCGGLPFKGVIHVGAHRGQEGPDYAANGVEKVIWVEANPEIIPELEKRTAALPLDQTYIQACLSDDEGTVEFNVANNEHSSSILKLGTHAKMYPHVKYTKTLEMPVHRFDKLAAEQSLALEGYDFINLDVQGAELKVLLGMGDVLKNKDLRAVYCEVNFEHVYEGCCLVDELDEYLKTFGFKRIATAAPEGTWGDSLYMRL
jgi:FkbM family methyltransferase